MFITALNRREHHQGPITEGLVGRWRLNEGSGAFAYDSSGNNYWGSLIDPGWGSGPPQLGGTVLSLNGTNAEVDIQNFSYLNISGALTLCCFFYADTMASLDGHLLMKGLKGFPSSSYYQYNQYGIGWHNGKARFDIFDATHIGALYTTQLTTSTWYHIAGVWNGTASANNQQVFVDGVLNNQGSQSSITTIPSVNAHLYIGKTENWAQADYFIDGKMADVRVYNRALSPFEIAAIAAGIG